MLVWAKADKDAISHILIIGEVVTCESQIRMLIHL